MSESDDKFRAAKKDLAYSYSLMEKNRPQPGMPQEMAQQSPEMAGEAPVEEVPNTGNPGVEEVVPEIPEEKGMVESIITGVVDAIKPMFEKKEEEPKEAVLKVEGTLEPKEKKAETSA